jgi:hypothetical protein
VRCCVSQKRDVGPRPPFICISQERSGTLIQISRTLWASKPECDAHICLNLGFTSQNFRLSQVPLRVCYFWLSSFRMDEGNPLPSEHGLCHKGWSAQIKALQPTFRPFQSLPQTLQPSEFVSQGYSRRSRLNTRPRCLDGTGTPIDSGLRPIRPVSIRSAEITSYKRTSGPE